MKKKNKKIIGGEMYLKTIPDNIINYVIEEKSKITSGNTYNFNPFSKKGIELYAYLLKDTIDLKTVSDVNNAFGLAKDRNGNIYQTDPKLTSGEAIFDIVNEFYEYANYCEDHPNINLNKNIKYDIPLTYEGQQEFISLNAERYKLAQILLNSPRSNRKKLNKKIEEIDSQIEILRDHYRKTWLRYRDIFKNFKNIFSLDPLDIFHSLNFEFNKDINLRNKIIYELDKSFSPGMGILVISYIKRKKRSENNNVISRNSITSNYLYPNNPKEYAKKYPENPMCIKACKSIKNKNFNININKRQSKNKSKCNEKCDFDYDTPWKEKTCKIGCNPSKSMTCEEYCHFTLSEAFKDFVWHVDTPNSVLT